MATTTLHISLPEELERYVQERVAAAAFSNPSDFVRNLIREDRERQTKLETLRRDLQLGIDELERGEGIPAEEVFRRLRERHRSAA